MSKEVNFILRILMVAMLIITGLSMAIILGHVNQGFVTIVSELVVIVNVVGLIFLFLWQKGNNKLLGSSTEITAIDISKSTITTNQMDRNDSNNRYHVSTIIENLENKYKELKLKKDLADKLLWYLCDQIDICQSIVYKKIDNEQFKIENTFAYVGDINKTITTADGLTGQVIKTGNHLFLNKVPEGYMEVISGLGKSSPQNLLIVPIIQGTELVGVMELASFTTYTKDEIKDLVGISNKFYTLAYHS